MAIQPIGSGVGGSPALYLPQPLDASAPVASAMAIVRAQPGYSVSDSASMLGGIAESDIAKLSALLDPLPLPETAARLQSLLLESASAIAREGDTAVMPRLAQIAALNLQTLEVLRVDPVWAPMQPHIDSLLTHLTSDARINAEASLARAAQFVQSIGGKPLPGWETRPETLLDAAHQLFDAGGYANYIRSAILTQAMVDFSPWIVPYSNRRISKTLDGDVIAGRALQRNLEKTLTSIRKRAQSQTRALWVRAPLLVLLLAWLALGFVAGPISLFNRSFGSNAELASLLDSFYEVWAIGFLVLVCFGFYARVRRIRF